MGFEQVEAIISELEPGQVITDPEIKQLVADAMSERLTQRRLARGYQSANLLGERALAEPASDALDYFGLRAS
jgi:hypothetical protein